MSKISFLLRFLNGRFLPLLAAATMVTAMGVAGGTTIGCGGGDGDEGGGGGGVLPPTVGGIELDSQTLAELSKDAGVNARRWFRVRFTVDLDTAVMEQMASFLDLVVVGASTSVSPGKSIAVGDKLDYMFKFDCEEGEPCNSVLLRSAIPYCTEFKICVKPGTIGANGEVLAEETCLLGVGGKPFLMRANPADITGDCKSDALMVAQLPQNNFSDEDGTAALAMGKTYLFGDSQLNSSSMSAFLMDHVNGLMLNDSTIEGTALYDGLIKNTYEDIGLSSGMTVMQLAAIPGDMNSDGTADAVLSRVGMKYECDIADPSDCNFAGLENPELLIWESGYGQDTPKKIIPSALITVPVDGASMSVPGLVARVGDLNNDGFDDMVVVGLTPIGTRSGKLDLYLGSASGVPELPSFSAEFPLAGHANLYPLIARGVGDLNNDGVDDFGLTVLDIRTASPIDWDFEGMQVMIFYGCNDGDTGCSAEEIAKPDVVISQPGSFDTGFGVSFAGGGDVNYDGYEDLVIGAPEGMWTVFARGVKAVIDEYTITGDKTRLGDFMELLSEEFKTSLANPSVAAPLSTAVRPNDVEDINLGKVYVFYGGPENFGASVSALTTADANATITGDNDQEGEGLGHLLGDILGTVNELFKEATSEEIDPNLPEITRLPDMFGMGVMLGDVDTDGLDEVIVGAPLAVDFVDSNFVRNFFELLRNNPNVPGVIDTVNNMVGEIGKVYIFQGSEDFEKGALTYADAKGEIVGSSSTGRKSFGFGAFLNSAVDVDNDGSDDISLGGFTLGTREWDFDGTLKTGPDIKYMKTIFRGGDIKRGANVGLIGESLIETTLAGANASMELDLIGFTQMLEGAKYIWVK